jgi:hypothetical protein
MSAILICAAVPAYAACGSKANLPDPEPLTGVQGIDAAIEISKTGAVLPITVNLSKNAVQYKDGIQASLTAWLAEQGVPSVWVHFNTNRGDGSGIAFWINESPYEYNLNDLADEKTRPAIIREVSLLHRAYIEMGCPQIQ